MRWFTQDKLKATIAGTFDLADWVQAFKLIEERTVVGKAVLVPEQPDRSAARGARCAMPTHWKIAPSDASGDGGRRRPPA